MGGGGGGGGGGERIAYDTGLRGGGGSILYAMAWPPSPPSPKAMLDPEREKKLFFKCVYPMQATAAVFGSVLNGAYFLCVVPIDSNALYDMLVQ